MHRFVAQGTLGHQGFDQSVNRFEATAVLHLLYPLDRGAKPTRPWLRVQKHYFKIFGLWFQHDIFTTPPIKMIEIRSYS